MKPLFLLVLSLLFSINLFAQQDWATLPENKNAYTSIYEIELINGKFYQFSSVYSSPDFVLQVDYYNPLTSSWETVASKPTTYLTKIISNKIGDRNFIATYDQNTFGLIEFNANGNTLVDYGNSYAFSGAFSNWTFETGINMDEFYILFTSTNLIKALEYSKISRSWTSSLISDVPQVDLASAQLEIQTINDSVYLAISTDSLYMAKYAKGNVSTIFPYNGIFEYAVYQNGEKMPNPGIVLNGDKDKNLSLFVTDKLLNISYDVPIDGNKINISPGTSRTGYNLANQIKSKESKNEEAYITSAFSSDGTSGLNQKTLITIKKDLSTSNFWNPVATPLENVGVTISDFTLKTTLDNTSSRFGVCYLLASSLQKKYKLLNQKPDTISGSSYPNSGICPNQMNELYSHIEITDEDYDPIRIFKAVSVNGKTDKIKVIPYGEENGIYKFKILGLPSTGNDQIEIFFTDGFDTLSRKLNNFRGSTSPIDIQFTSNPIILCANETQFDISEKLNYYDQGSFRLNGDDLSTSLLNIKELKAKSLNSGKLHYLVNVNGCIISAEGDFSIVEPAQLTTTTTNTPCGQKNGTATVSIIPGTSNNVSFYWSTGETTSIIQNLKPGPYYVHAKDDNGCKSTALAAVEASDVIISETINAPSCADKTDGSIKLNINSSTPYTIVWSTGHVNDELQGIGFGTYEYSYYAGGTCQITKKINLFGPDKLMVNLVATKPDCGQANGTLIALTKGGDSNYNYLWNDNSTTPTNTNLPQGFYSVQVTDGSGCTVKDSVFLNDNYGVLISDSVILTSCELNNGGIDLQLIEHPSGGQINSILWSTGDNTEDIFNLSSGNYQVTVNSGSNCVSQKNIFVGTKQPLKNEICLVTVDLNSTTNMVVWEKIETENISHYNIYRENSNAGEFMLIDTVQFSNLSVFNDVVASPIDRSWRYRIAAVNKCNIESPLSIAHKTLHLNTIKQIGNGQIAIYWDDYEGISDGIYYINRYSKELGWEVLPQTVPFGSTTSFIDTPPVNLTELDYYVDFELKDICTATEKSQDFNRSRSNKDRGIFAPGEGEEGYSNNSTLTLKNESLNVSVYPNPFQNELTINYQGDIQIEVKITDINGKVIETKSCETGVTILNTSTLENGIYYIKITAKEFNHFFKLIK